MTFDSVPTALTSSSVVARMVVCECLICAVSSIQPSSTSQLARTSEVSLSQLLISNPFTKSVLRQTMAGVV